MDGIIMHMGYLFKARYGLLAAALALMPAFDGHGGIEESQYAGSIDAAPIQYNTGKPADAVARLVADVNAGRRTLAWDPHKGYLPAVLKELNIPVESQVLVYSKTSFQNSRISPATPRAIYFNDDVYVGWVQHGDVLEIAATDPQRGPIFYTLPQQRTQPRDMALGRNQQCLQCHVANRTMGVPGPTRVSNSFSACESMAPSRCEAAPGPLRDHRLDWFEPLLRALCWAKKAKNFGKGVASSR